MTKTKFANASNEDDLQWKMTSKYKMCNISLISRARDATESIPPAQPSAPLTLTGAGRRGAGLDKTSH